jgi:hypothetical protein
MPNLLITQLQPINHIAMNSNCFYLIVSCCVNHYTQYLCYSCEHKTLPAGRFPCIGLRTLPVGRSIVFTYWNKCYLKQFFFTFKCSFSYLFLSCCCSLNTERPCQTPWVHQSNDLSDSAVHESNSKSPRSPRELYRCSMTSSYP